MSPKFADFLWQLFLMAVFAFISFIAKEYWHSISSSSKTSDFSEVNLKKIRYQFFFSMILLIISIVASVYKGIHIKTTKNGLPTY